MFEVIDGPQAGRKCDSDDMTDPSLNCKTHAAEHHRSDGISTKQSYVNTLDYFRSSTNKEADKEASRLITLKIDIDFSDFYRNGMFEDTFQLRLKEGNHLYQALPRRVAYTLPQPLKRRTRSLAKAAGNCTFGCG